MQKPKSKAGRKPKNGKAAMSSAERQKAYRDRKRATALPQGIPEPDERAMRARLLAAALVHRVFELGYDDYNDPEKQEIMACARRLLNLVGPAVHLVPESEFTACGLPAEALGKREALDPYAFDMASIDRRCSACSGRYLAATGRELSRFTGGKPDWIRHAYVGLL